jgi:hypothetical protein
VIAFLLREQLVILTFAMEPLDTVAISLLEPKRNVMLKREMSNQSNPRNELGPFIECNQKTSGKCTYLQQSMNLPSAECFPGRICDNNSIPNIIGSVKPTQQVRTLQSIDQRSIINPK